jgi:sugar phosphate isomerase/epimerase
VKLSCLPVSFYPDLASGRMSLADWFRIAARLGLDGADVSVAHLEYVAGRGPADLDRLRQQAAEAGVEIPILVTYSDFTHPDPEYRSRQIDNLRDWIAAAARLRATFVRVTAGQAYPDVGELDGLDWAAEGLTACLDEARAAGVRLLYENHTRGSTWARNDFTQPAARFLGVIERTRETGLEVLFDTANNLVLDDDPAAVLERVLDRVGAVHLSDIARRGEFGPTTIGTGVAPLRALVDRIRSAGFDGWISIEEASRTGEDGFRRAVEFADRLWIEAGGAPRERSPRI